jgi:hypothetical protein
MFIYQRSIPLIWGQVLSWQLVTYSYCIAILLAINFCGTLVKAKEFALSKVAVD